MTICPLFGCFFSASWQCSHAFICFKRVLATFKPHKQPSLLSFYPVHCFFSTPTTTTTALVYNATNIDVFLLKTSLSMPKICMDSHGNTHRSPSCRSQVAYPVDRSS